MAKTKQHISCRRKTSRYAAYVPWGKSFPAFRLRGAATRSVTLPIVRYPLPGLLTAQVPGMRSATVSVKLGGGSALTWP